ncbi:hypothetical protein IQ06DRAFT_375330 [Phaeosphaeriaceae sp. SRC1lsM3a]|nr:hypothetical protein IQ06DRAFT_375330 [Stagonospora sp. SRC1lsM3a]
MSKYMETLNPRCPEPNEIELFGSHNFGASFRVPGTVTIGPDFVSSAPSLEMLPCDCKSVARDQDMSNICANGCTSNATYEVGYPNFDYSMRYPVPAGEVDEPKAEETPTTPKMPEASKSFGWDMNANDQITARVIPKVTFGIVFDSDSVANGAVNLITTSPLENVSLKANQLDLGINTHVQLYANAKVGSSQAFKACYGANGGTKLFGNIEAPTVFGQPLSRYYTLKQWGTYVVIPKKCSNDAKRDN